MTAKQYMGEIKLTAADYVRIVEEAAGVKLTNIDLGTYQRLTKIHREYLPRIVAITVMIQEGLRVVTISRVLGILQATVYQSKRVGEEMLDSKPGYIDYNKEFKQLYLAVMGRIADIEEAA